MSDLSLRSMEHEKNFVYLMLACTIKVFYVLRSQMIDYCIEKHIIVVDCITCIMIMPC